ncbi:Ca2+-transporting ATPase [Sporothrix schenckii 1099-18]|uniref:P-type Ca(2+) transporter n=1 Tax=Sporothrix schenckii 1099-18 TaxID=1397361 RepID=A0A0F2MCC3_SPOSC|nr:Ca2+-transporting ATPase [Sporothrix schenckii 1099-18]KJR85811.1 Ca2+-transporting ATPase [Sporothrix schenckii 1099-18]
MDRLTGGGANEYPLPLFNGKDVPRLSTPQPSGRDDYHGRRSRSPNHVRTTSAQSRSIAEEYAFLTPAETAQRLQTSLTHGLTPVEGVARLRDGANEIPHDPPRAVFKEPLIILLLISAGASVLVGNTSDAISITVAVTIVVTVGFVQEYRSEKSIEALNHLVPDHAHLIRTATKDATPGARPSPVGNWPGSSTDANGDPQTPSDPRLQLSDLDTVSGTVTPTEEVIQATSTKVLAQQLVPGDLVLFTTGDRIPADIRVTKAVDLTIDASNLTGENEPVRLTSDVRSRVSLPFSPGVHPKSPGNSLPLPSPIGNGPGPNPGGSLSASADSHHNDKNIAYMGTLVKSGHGQGIVFATGGNTHFGTISLSVSGTESPRSPLQLSMDDLGAQLSKFSFVVIGLISLIGWLQGKGLLDIFTISISLAVAAIPEGLPIIVTVTLALGVHRMASRNAIVRKMPKVETLGSVNVVCTDKTGTLTMNHMTVTKLWYFGRAAPVEVDAEEDVAEAKPDAAATRILRIGNIANNARLSRRYRENGAGARAVLSSTLNQEDGPLSVSRWVGQPTDVAVMDLVDRYKEHDVRDAIGPRVVETPFSSERKWMGVTIGSSNNSDGSNSGGGNNNNTNSSKNDKEFAYIKGALDRVLEACDTYVSDDGREFVLDGKRKQEAIEEADKLASQGLRVIAFASGPVSKSSKSRAAAAAAADKDKSGHHHVVFSDEPYKGLTFAGLVGMSDPPRPGVGRSIRKLMRGGVKVIMITGDAETTALAIGHQLGMSIARPVEHAANQVAVHPVLRGEDVEALSEEDLAQAMQQTTIFARTNPDHKMKIIRALQARGDIVAMTGDGVNDAPALKKADIGIAMGRHGTDVAKEAADMILTDDDFSTILHAIEEGKGIFNNIQNFLTFQLSTSAAGLSLVLLCTCLGFKSPLNAMQILWISESHTPSDPSNLATNCD